jgi:putative Ca2+/H+ antiporter (TMEM165/GDT1 family)
MDWKLYASTAGAVFLAELGDKTQLATFALAGGDRSRWAVFLGAVTALTLTSGIAVVAGDAVTRAIPPVWIRRGAGAVFVALGLLYLLGSERS